MIRTEKVTPEQADAFVAQQARIREQMGFGVPASGLPLKGGAEIAKGGPLPEKAGPVIEISGPVDPEAYERIKRAAERNSRNFFDSAAVRKVTTQDVQDGVMAILPPATAMLFQLVIAHDGSLGAALSKAIVARAEQIGLQALVSVSGLHDEGPKDSAPSLSGKPLMGTQE